MDTPKSEFNELIFLNRELRDSLITAKADDSNSLDLGWIIKRFSLLFEDRNDLIDVLWFAIRMWGGMNIISYQALKYLVYTIYDLALDESGDSVSELPLSSNHFELSERRNKPLSD